MAEPLWTPSPEQVARAQVTGFARSAGERHGVDLPDYRALHAWSVAHSDAFWNEVWEQFGVVGERGGDTALLDADRMPGARWYPDARLNFAENLLRRRDDAVAIVFNGEDRVSRSLTFAELYDQVSRLSRALAAMGVVAGDRVAGYLPNMPETVVAMLATTSLGAIWSSCSPDFGVRGVVDRFGQIEPKVLFTADGYFYAGKEHDCLAKVRDVLGEIPSVSRVVVVPYTKPVPSLAGLPQAVRYDELLGAHEGGDIRFNRVPFAHPLYIMYSSGTTGLPKCMVQSAGGILIHHLKELMLQSDLKREDTIFYFTTCGWMMWNWLVSSTSSSRRW